MRVRWTTKIAVRFLHPNGNAFIYAGYLPKEETDKGYISVLKAMKERSVSCWKRRFPFRKRLLMAMWKATRKNGWIGPERFYC